MTFYTARRRNVRAVQWFKPGDHEAVVSAQDQKDGVLDRERAELFSRRLVQPGDWIVENAAGRLHVLTHAEFSAQFENV